MQLSDMSMGQKGRVLKILAGEKAYRQRLIALGLIPGTELMINHIAPFGDPIEILVRGFALSLRKEEACILQIEGISG